MKQKIEGGWAKGFRNQFAEKIVLLARKGEKWTPKQVNDLMEKQVKFISTEIEKAKASERQRCVEVAVKYMKGRSIDIPVGSPTPVIVTEHLAKLELLEQLK